MTIPHPTDPLPFQAASSTNNIIINGKHHHHHGHQQGRQSRSKRKDRPPSRSVSPSNQSAGILFRVAPDSGIESVCVGGYVGVVNFTPGPSTGPGPISTIVNSPPTDGIIATTRNNNNNNHGNNSNTREGRKARENISLRLLIGVPSSDYGFGMAAREQTKSHHHHHHQAESGVYSPLLPDSPEATQDDEDYSGIIGGTSGRSTSPSALVVGGRMTGGNSITTVATAMVGRKKGSGTTTSGNGRCCVSCGATKTPYWREAWSTSVLLCNACGLRYSKFRRRCLDCCYVPRKEDKGSRFCSKCGGPWS